MKKIIILLFTLLLITSFVACKKEIIEEDEIIETWGIQLSATNITSSGLTLVCNQSDGEPTGELLTGSYYILEEKLENQWVPVDMFPSENELEWTAEAWIIPMDEIVEWEVNWENLYGELPNGNYRIGKEIMDFRDSGDYDKKNYYADFKILN